jgi:hypothetical protein
MSNGPCASATTKFRCSISKQRGYSEEASTFDLSLKDIITIGEGLIDANQIRPGHVALGLHLVSLASGPAQTSG